jgi:hypothetical protein
MYSNYFRCSKCALMFGRRNSNDERIYASVNEIYFEFVLKSCCCYNVRSVIEILTELLHYLFVSGFV